MSRSHLVAILQALLVAFLWSTSWVFIKIGLNDIDIPPLIFAGLRYSLAFTVLLAYGVATRRVQIVRSLAKQQWLLLAILGLVLYTLTQGSQFVALVYLPSATLSLLLNFTIIIVALMGIIWLQEYPTRGQLCGIIVFLAGVLLYFYPLRLPSGIWFGLLIGALSTGSNALAGVLGRYINRTSTLAPYTVTLVSMGVGGPLLLASGLATEPLPAIPLVGWGIIAWLAIVNTAFAFTLWNLTLRKLQAVESSVIANTMMIQIAALAWVFLGEAISPRQGLALLIAALGIIIVQVMRPLGWLSSKPRAARSI